MRYATPPLGNAFCSPFSVSGSSPRSITFMSRVIGAPARLSGSTIPSTAERRAMTLPSVPVESGVNVTFCTTVPVVLTPANMAVRAASCAARLSSTSFMASPSAGGLSAWPERMSERVSRSSKIRWAASSAFFDTDALRAISCVTACRAASPSRGDGAAGLAAGTTGIIVVEPSALMPMGILSGESVM